MFEKEKLKELYIDPIKNKEQSLVGIELEFPIANLEGKATDSDLTKSLMRYLADMDRFIPKKFDSDQNPIELEEKGSGDLILFEVSYANLEFAFAPETEIASVEKRFTGYLDLIQSFLAKGRHAVVGQGIHPNWKDNHDSIVKTPRYQMLVDYLSMAQDYPDRNFHTYPNYGAFISGNQVQLDVSPENYLQVLNAFNQIEPAKAYLFANSEFPGENWDTKISRDLFWENSMHGFYPENAGVFPRNFSSENDFLDYLLESSVFTTERDSEMLYFEPIRVKDYLSQNQIEARNSKGEKVLIQPNLADLDYHRAYHFQSLTRRGTIEFRSVCAQPLTDTFSSPAFHIGLLENLEELENVLAKAAFFEKEGDQIFELRRKYSQKSLTSEDQALIKAFAKEVLEVAQKGLEARGFGEERYIAHLFDKVKS